VSESRREIHCGEMINFPVGGTTLGDGGLQKMPRDMVNCLIKPGREEDVGHYPFRKKSRISVNKTSVQKTGGRGGRGQYERKKRTNVVGNKSK